MWLRKMGGPKRGQRWDKDGTKTGRDTHFSQSHFPHCSGGRRSSPHQIQLTALTDGKMGLFATHQRTPPRRLMRMLGKKTPTEGHFSELQCR